MPTAKSQANGVKLLNKIIAQSTVSYIRKLLGLYLGVYLISLTKFKCSFSNNKAGFFSRH